MMLAARELNVDKLPQSSRNWINEKLIYTHGYGVTMNPVNGFTPEGLPTLVLSNMPIQSTIPGLTVTRPEIYYGELTNTDVYVKTRQKEFNYPQGDANNLTSYQGNGGIRLGGWLRRTLIALDRGDLAKLPFSDDVNSESRLLMRRTLTERVHELAPFLTLDPDPYVVVGEDGRIYWLMDAFTTSDSYPYARRYTLGNERINYIRNSVKILIDAYTGETTFYVFDTHDPVIAAYRAVFPGLFTDAAAMPAAVRKHVRYPELLLNVQAAVYGLYHMTNPDVFYNREDLWSVATEVGIARSAPTGHGTELRADDPAGRTVDRIHRDPAVHTGQSQQPDRLDCGSKRRRTLWRGCGLRLSQDQADRRTRADRGAHRSERPVVRSVVIVESARFARAPRQPDRHSDRAGAALRGAHLPASGSQSHA